MDCHNENQESITSSIVSTLFSARKNRGKSEQNTVQAGKSVVAGATNTACIHLEALGQSILFTLRAIFRFIV